MAAGGARLAHLALLAVRGVIEVPRGALEAALAEDEIAAPVDVQHAVLADDQRVGGVGRLAVQLDGLRLNHDGGGRGRKLLDVPVRKWTLPSTITELSDLPPTHNFSFLHLFHFIA